MIGIKRKGKETEGMGGKGRRKDWRGEEGRKRKGRKQSHKIVIFHKFIEKDQ